jgi:hypothetical protein
MLVAKLARAATQRVRIRHASEVRALEIKAEPAFAWTPGVPLQRSAEADPGEKMAAAAARRTALQGCNTPSKSIQEGAKVS